MSFHCSRVSGPQRALWSKQCCVLVRDVIISLLPIIWQMLIEIMLFQVERHTSSDPKLINKERDGRREGVMDSGAVGQHFTCRHDLMLEGWLTCSDSMGRGVLQAWAWRAGAVTFKCLYSVTSEQCLVHIKDIQWFLQWTNEQIRMFSLKILFIKIQKLTRDNSILFWAYWRPRLYVFFASPLTCKTNLQEFFDGCCC